MKNSIDSDADYSRLQDALLRVDSENVKGYDTVYYSKNDRTLLSLISSSLFLRVRVAPLKISWWKRRQCSSGIITNEERENGDARSCVLSM